MLVIKDLYSDISDCFWLFYGSKYKYVICNKKDILGTAMKMMII